MTLRPLALALAFVTMTCSTGRPASAETESAPAPAACGAYRELAETLRQRYGETPRFRAEENRGFALEFFAYDGGSWTLVMRRDEEACAIAAGAAWRAGTDTGL